MSDPVMGANSPETLSLRDYAEKAYLDYSMYVILASKYYAGCYGANSKRSCD